MLQLSIHVIWEDDWFLVIVYVCVICHSNWKVLFIIFFMRRIRRKKFWQLIDEADTSFIQVLKLHGIFN